MPVSTIPSAGLTVPLTTATVTTLTTTTISDGTNSTSSTNAIQGSAKAWVNFNGVTTTTIRASYNVSSVTRTATGDYVVNFTTAFADANYATLASAGRNATGSGGYIALPSDKTAQTTSAVQIYTINTAGTTLDAPYVSVSCFR
jgi:hypothetical protein